MLKTTELRNAPNPSNSSQFFRTYIAYSLYLSTFFLFSISLYQNTLATLHHPALIHWFVFPLLILQDATRSISFSIYSSGMGYIASSLSRAALPVACVGSTVWLPSWIYRPTCTHSFKKSRFRTFGSSNHHAKTRRRSTFRTRYSRYSEISFYLIAARLGPPNPMVVFVVFTISHILEAHLSTITYQKKPRIYVTPLLGRSLK